MTKMDEKSSNSGLSVDQQQLVSQHIPLALHLARAYTRTFPSLGDDLNQEALLALVEAISRYDAVRGKPERWIAYRVKGALADFLRSKDDLSQTERVQLNEVRAWQHDAEQLLGHPPSCHEVAGLILKAAVLPEWIAKDVRSLRKKRLQQRLETASAEAELEMMRAAVTTEEIADVLDAVLAIGTCETVSTEDLPGYQPAGPDSAMTQARLRKDVLFVDKCFAALPLKQRMIVRLEFAGIPTKISALILGVAPSNAYLQFQKAKTNLAELIRSAPEQEEK